jgi:hypothetical protein
MNPDTLTLRDIHLPEPVSWWPPAPGWWVAAGLLVTLGLGAVWLYRWRSAKQNSPLAIARGEFETVRTAWAEHRDAQRLVREISVWLRRVSITLYSRRDAASLTGDRWRSFLDEVAGETIFGDAEGQVLTEAPYRAADEIDSDSDQLLRLCETWLGAVSRNEKGGLRD